jgi:hypothetical protein
MLMDKITYQDGWPVIAGGSPSITEQEGPKWNDAQNSP